MLNLIVRRGRSWSLAVSAVLVLCSVAGRPAAATEGTLSAVFSFDLNQTQAGVVEGDGAYQGTFYGTTYYTSLSYGGSIYTFTVNDPQPKVLYQLQSTDGYQPGSLILGNDHKLYGVTKYAARLGSNQTTGYGTVFVINQDGSGFKTLHTFANDSSEGVYPQYRLVDGEDGYLYGVTTAGGRHGTGTIFRVSYDGGDFKAIHHFDALDSNNTSADGSTPSSELIRGSDGLLYGVTSTGGYNVWTTSSSGNTSTGTIYRIETGSTDSYETLFSFDSLNDANSSNSGGGTNESGVKPLGGLVEMTRNHYVGTASDGGKYGYGTLYALDVSGSTPKVTSLYDFDGTNGSSPYGSLLKASADNRVYGIASGTSTDSSNYTAYGVIYAFDVQSVVYEVVHRIVPSDGTSLTKDALIEASSGDMFGTAANGGACTANSSSGYGTVYHYSPAASTLPTSYSSCTPASSSGGGDMGPGILMLLAMLGMAPPIRRRLFN